jgi:hypothetical protein
VARAPPPACRHHHNSRKGRCPIYFSCQDGAGANLGYRAYNPSQNPNRKFCVLISACISPSYVYVKREMVALTADDINCIIAYIVPLNLWYVLPVEAFSPCKNLWFHPHGSKKGSRFESFREAWWLVDPELKPASTEPAAL